MDDEELLDFRNAVANFEQDTVARAANGDSEAAEEVIAMAITGLLSGVMPEPVRYYMAERLRRIIEDGDAPKDALGLTKPAHRKKGSGAWSAEQVAATVEVFARKFSKTCAVRIATDAFCLDETSVYRHCKNASYVNLLDADVLNVAACVGLRRAKSAVQATPLNYPQEVLDFLLAE